MKYDVGYFITKFEPIPEDNWIAAATLSNGYKIESNNTCAMGFCGGYPDDSEESKSLANILKQFYESNSIQVPKLDAAIVWNINDYNDLIDLPTPKQRILASLYDIKKSNEAVRETQDIINAAPIKKLQTIQ